MDQTKALLNAAIQMVGCDAPREQPGDFMGEDGLLYCGNCKTAKQRFLTMPPILGGGKRIVYKSCECVEKEYERKEAERQHAKDLEILSTLRKESLMDTMFSDSRFSGAKITEDNRYPISVARRYAERFNEMLVKNRGLLFYGPPGTGKTFAAACIANELLERRIPVMMTSFVKINAAGFGEDDSLIQKMSHAKLLIIDDLGAERSSEFTLERVYNVIDSRIRDKLPMILTTNLSLQQMQETSDTRYWRIYDRIFQCCWPLEFKGRSFRRREAKRLYSEMESLFPDEN